MKRLLTALRNEKNYKDLCRHLTDPAGKKKYPVLASGFCEGAADLFYAALIDDLKKKGPALLILPSEKECAKTAAALEDFGLRPMLYQLRDMVLQNIVASHEFEHERLAVLDAILTGKCDAVLTTPDAAMQYTMPPAILKNLSRTIRIDGSYDPDELCRFLVACGYTAADMVDAVGQFSKRGGILDIYPPNLEKPVRIEFFDTVIDRMTYFDVITQRFSETVDSFYVTPVREVISDAEARKKLADEVRTLIGKTKNETAKNALYDEREALLSDRELNCIDKYISFIYPQKACLFDYFGEDSLVFLQEYPQILNRAKAFDWQESENIKQLLQNGLVSGAICEYSCGIARFRETLESRSAVIVNGFVSRMDDVKLDGIFTFASKQTGGCYDDLAVLQEEISDYLALGYQVFVSVESEMAGKNLAALLKEAGYEASFNEQNPSGPLSLLVAPRLPGFELSAEKLALISSTRGMNSVKGGIRRGSVTPKKENKNSEKIFSYTDLAEGDYIVHEKYGIGRYLGTKSLLVEGVRRDFIQIQYAGTDVLYLPCEQLDAISKYIGTGGDDSLVRLSKMGGSEWVKAKTKVKAAAKEMAKELIALYARRQRMPGYAFPPDSAMEREFADNFQYVETQGQLDAIDDINRDMEAPHPMDRLLCGDVGYGKTEVAMRAAFKAVCDGKQVAILVPTTILALQHYETLQARMQGFPVSVDMLSRFRSPKQQAATLRKVARGEVDIVVGTHRILSKDIVFHDLGLVIIDEEQRFGVAQKEKLRQIAANVDTLTLTATPIPRTLNMAMSGIRDMSVLEEAPGDRFPVQSYVTEYDEIILFDAIKRELRRGGQVFYLCNRVERMERTAAAIAKEIPEARIAIANGQMDKEELSDIWHSLIVGETDILVCTTIIETGVDVPNANTLIIEDADKMGLSQLHQLRGRVGRSSRRAYAYFTYPKNRVLSEVAAKRLSAIRDFTEFGAGFKVAMRDLEIRGAGNILGAEQHGNMAAVGYEMYMRLLDEAILEEKGEKTASSRTECTIDFNVDAYIPEKYISNANHRLEAYKKISLIRNANDLYDVNDELMDRFGPMPDPVSTLVNISYLRAIASDCGLARVEYRDRTIVCYPEKIDLETWSEMAAKNNGKLLISLGVKPHISCRVKNKEWALDTATRLLKEYLKVEESHKH